MVDRALVELYDATTWYWESRFYRRLYAPAYRALFGRLARRGWLEECGTLQVLDCGIGAGLLSACLIDVLGRQHAVYGIDSSRGMLQRAGARLRRAGVVPQLALADICRLPFRDRLMDLVMAALVLEHVPRPSEALREMIRTARPEAVILLIAVRPGAPDWPFRLRFRYRPYSQDDMVAWMKGAGVANICVEQLTGMARPFAHAFVGLRR